jgi:hypothetical protein
MEWMDGWMQGSLICFACWFRRISFLLTKILYFCWEEGEDGPPLWATFEDGDKPISNGCPYLRMDLKRTLNIPILSLQPMLKTYFQFHHASETRKPYYLSNRCSKPIFSLAFIMLQK